MIAPVSAALDYGVNIGLGVEYTDNADLVPRDEEDDWIVDSALGFFVAGESGAWTTDISASYSHQEYLNDTFDSQDYLNINGEVQWEPIQNRLIFNVANFYSQVPIDTLDSDTPDNRQDINVFSFTPEIRTQISPRNTLVLSPQFQDFYYEEDDTDNQQYGLSATWNYYMYPTVAVGLDGNVRDVSYDYDDLNPDYTISTIQAFLSRKLSRTQYNISLGGTHIDRDQFENQEGAIGSLDWLYELTTVSSIRAYLSSSLTDASSDFLGSSVDPGTGDFANEQVSGDVLRNNTFRLAYQRDGDTFNTGVWAELRDLDYKETPDDQEVQEYGINFEYKVSSLLSTGINGVYTETDRDSDGRSDEEYSIGGNVGYNISKKLRCNFNLGYRQKDSNDSAEEYDEFSAFAGLVYDIFGRRSSAQ